MNMNKRNTITLTLLRTLGEMAIEGVELCEAILIAGYGASSFRIDRTLKELRNERVRGNTSSSTPIFKDEKRCIRNYQKLLSKLKAQGFVVEENASGKRMFALSKKGKLKLTLLERRQLERLPSTVYEAVPSERPVIVSFDIPIKKNRKRDWLREVLKRFGLRMVHRSLWIGKRKLPKPFLDDLEQLNLLQHVEIFEVGRTGTLRHIV